MVNLLSDMKDSKKSQQEMLSSNSNHFKRVVAATVKLPLTDPDSIQVLNDALAEMDLSVCVVLYSYHFISKNIMLMNMFYFKCCLYIHKFRSLTSKDIIAKAVVNEMLTSQLCTKVHWKPRGKDKRFGFGHLVNFVSVCCGRKRRAI